MWVLHTSRRSPRVRVSAGRKDNCTKVARQNLEFRIITDGAYAIQLYLPTEMFWPLSNGVLLYSLYITAVLPRGTDEPAVKPKDSSVVDFVFQIAMDNVAL